MAFSTSSSSFLVHSLFVIALAILFNLLSPIVYPSVQPIFNSLSSLHKSSSNMSTVTLIGSPFSTCTRRVATVLKEKNVPYVLQPVDFTKGEHKSPDYLATKQPFGQVPVLQDGDFQIFESRAIARYVATKYANQGTPGLLPSPANLEAWAKFEQAASIEQNNFDPYASGIAAEKVFKPMKGGATNEAVVKEYTETLKAKLKAYEVILSKQKYLAGDEVTLADLFHLPYGAFISERLGFDLLTSGELPNVTRWWNDITSRPSWLAVKDGA